MNTTKKTLLLIASAAIILGALLSFGAMLTMHFDFSAFSQTDFTSHTYTIEESFQNISVEDSDCTIQLLPSGDNTCKIVCFESKKVYYTITADEDTLSVKRNDSLKWYDCIGITYWPDTALTVYLPQTEYNQLCIKSAAGEIEIPDSFTFNDVRLENSSGDVSFQASVNNALTVQAISGEVFVSGPAPRTMDVSSTSGDVTLFSVHPQTQLNANTVSGEIELSDIKGGNISVNSTSGDISFTNVIASERLQAETVSGDIELTDSDANDLQLSTTSGEVSGTLLAGKLFSTNTVSGDVDVPASTDSGTCRIETISGDIDIRIRD